MQRCPDFACDLICLEPSQELSGVGICCYYVVAGNGDLKAGKYKKPINMGKLAFCEKGESHTVVNSSEQRLILLAIAAHS